MSNRAPSLHQYGLVSDCHSAALISANGSVDWWCVPRFDSGSCFGRLLDWSHGGHCSLTPVARVESRTAYLDRTLVLERVLRRPGAEARVWDFLALGEHRRLVRIVEGVKGEMRWSVELVPRFDYGKVRPWIRRDGDGAFRVLGGDDGLTVHSDAPLQISERHELGGELEVKAGARARLALTYTRPHLLDEPVVGPSPQELDQALQDTVAWWRDWAAHLDPDDHPPDVVRSALTLRALVFEPTGAMVAAPTTSLPETRRGQRNWDYRFSWIRDSSFAARALADLGCRQEPDRLARFVMRSAAGHAEELQVAYGVGGERRINESRLDLRGYRGANPVRIGNDAVTQSQHDEMGEILNLAWRWHRRGHVFDDDEWAFLADVVDAAADLWREPDQGFWESRGAPRHFVHSKAACWSALSRGLELAEALRRRAPRGRWRKQRDAAHACVLEEGYDAQRQTFVQVVGEPQLDCVALLLPVTGVVPWEDPRMLGTVRQLQAKLGDRGLLCRYEGDDGLPGKEGAFLACSFWMARCLARQGLQSEAIATYRRATRAASPLGLYPEEADPRNDQPLGNFPQGLTHLAHIEAALALRAQPLSERPAPDADPAPARRAERLSPTARRPPSLLGDAAG